MDPVVVGDVDDRPAAADEQDRVVLGELLLDLVEPGVVRLHVAQERRRAVVRALRDPGRDVDRLVVARRRVERLDLVGDLLRGDRLAERRIDVLRIHARRQRRRPLALRRREVDLVAGLVERLERADELLAPVAEFGEDDEDALRQVPHSSHVTSTRGRSSASPDGPGTTGDPVSASCRSDASAGVAVVEGWR